MTLKQLKQLVQGTLLETSDDLLDSSRPIRPRSAYSGQTQLQLDDLDQTDRVDEEEEDNGINNNNVDDNEDDEGGDEELDGGESRSEGGGDSQSSPDEGEEEEEGELSFPASTTEVDDESLSSEEEPEQSEFEKLLQQDESLDDEEQTNLEEPSSEQGDLEPANKPLAGDNTLQEFDVKKVLSPSDSYLVFIPSGETIEAQFFSLLTSLWIAKHSNRTLIIPPPMMAPPSLYHLYPIFAGNKGRKRQRWSTLFDLRFIANLQRTVLMDTTRPVLQTPFTAEMAKEEENPTNATQSVPYSEPVTNDEDDDATVTPAGSIVPVNIKCHGPPTAGSWKALDFAGRHFLNRYNLLAEFEILGDPYWSLKPEAISRHWRATKTKAGGQAGAEDRHRQFICISGVELVGSENAAIEEMIWQEIGLQIGSRMR
ncbi:hypothetical protein BGX24_003677, partial [Mortierella sp. AD032]